MRKRQPPYQPRPRELDHVHLAPEIAGLMEPLATHVHDLWAEARLAEGWIPGTDLDRSRRIHPSLVPYADLP